MRQNSDSASSNSGASRGTAVLGMVVTFLGGYVLGSMGQKGEDSSADPAKVSRKLVPVQSSPTKGPDDALVTIVEFADFQCGYCARSVPVERRLFNEYRGKIRWVFKHMPLSFHKRAMAAARASLAAHAQGKFWEYHDRLFTNRDKLSDQDLVEHARILGLDVARFKKDLASNRFDDAIAADKRLAGQLKVQGTPNFFVNGRHFVGSLGYARFEKAVREEIAHGMHLVRSGVARDQLYDRLTTEGAKKKPAKTNAETGKGASKAQDKAKAAEEEEKEKANRTRKPRQGAAAPARKRPGTALHLGHPAVRAVC